MREDPEEPPRSAECQRDFDYRPHAARAGHRHAACRRRRNGPWPPLTPSGRGRVGGAEEAHDLVEHGVGNHSIRWIRAEEVVPREMLLSRTGAERFEVLHERTFDERLPGAD